MKKTQQKKKLPKIKNQSLEKFQALFQLSYSKVNGHLLNLESQLIVNQFVTLALRIQLTLLHMMVNFIQELMIQLKEVSVLRKKHIQ